MLDLKGGSTAALVILLSMESRTGAREFRSGWLAPEACLKPWLEQARSSFPACSDEELLRQAVAPLSLRKRISCDLLGGIGSDALMVCSDVAVERSPGRPWLAILKGQASLGGSDGERLAAASFSSHLSVAVPGCVKLPESLLSGGDESSIAMAAISWHERSILGSHLPSRASGAKARSI